MLIYITSTLLILNHAMQYTNEIATIQLTEDMAVIIVDIWHTCTGNCGVGIIINQVDLPCIYNHYFDTILNTNKDILGS